MRKVNPGWLTFAELTEVVKMGWLGMPSWPGSTKNSWEQKNKERKKERKKEVLTIEREGQLVIFVLRIRYQQTSRCKLFHHKCVITIKTIYYEILSFRVQGFSSSKFWIQAFFLWFWYFYQLEKRIL